jgi:hypothetical protein
MESHHNDSQAGGVGKWGAKNMGVLVLVLAFVPGNRFQLILDDNFSNRGQ